MRSLINLLNFTPGIRWKRHKKKQNTPVYTKSSQQLFDRTQKSLFFGDPAQHPHVLRKAFAGAYVRPCRSIKSAAFHRFQIPQFCPFTAGLELERTTAAYILFSGQTYLLWITDIDRFAQLCPCLSGTKLKEEGQKQAENLAARSIKSWPQIVRSMAGEGS